jgi:hypothetical protein
VKEQAPSKNLMDDSIMVLRRFASVCCKSPFVGVGNRAGKETPPIGGFRDRASLEAEARMERAER